MKYDRIYNIDKTGLVGNVILSFWGLQLLNKGDCEKPVRELRRYLHN